MAKFRNLIFKPIRYLMAALERRAVSKHQLLLWKRLRNQRITTDKASDHANISSDKEQYARDKSEN
jgi:hypothetical protein